MRVFLFGVIAFCYLMLSVTLAFGQARPGDLYKWDQASSEVANIDHFELRIDPVGGTPGNWANVGKVEANDAQTQPNSTSFSAVVPASTSGAYIFAVRACPSTGECGPASSPFSYSIVIISQPTNLRISPAPPPN